MIPYSDQHDFPNLLGLEVACREPVIVRSFELLWFGDARLVRATGADGLAGVAVCNYQAQVLSRMMTQLVFPLFLGRDARKIESLVNEAYAARDKYHGVSFWNCVAYVEAALFDLLGNASGKSVGELIGKSWRDEIPIYLSFLRRDTTPEAELDLIAFRLAATGARAARFKIGGRMSKDADSLPGHTEALITRVRERLGPDITLYVDANGYYSVPKAVDIGRLLEQHGYAWFEEPCPFEQYEATRAVADALDITVAGGEQDCNLALFRMMIRDRVVDLVQPDLMYNGGLIRALRVAHLAREAGMKVTPHSPKYGPELATLLHFAAVVGNTGPYMEFSGAAVQYAAWCDPAFTIQPGGTVRVPSGPSLGVRYDPDIWRHAQHC